MPLPHYHCRQAIPDEDNYIRLCHIIVPGGSIVVRGLMRYNTSIELAEAHAGKTTTSSYLHFASASPLSRNLLLSLPNQFCDRRRRRHRHRRRRPGNIKRSCVRAGIVRAFLREAALLSFCRADASRVLSFVASAHGTKEKKRKAGI